MGLLTESGLMKVAEFEKVSFDQFVQDWENRWLDTQKNQSMVA